MTSLLKRQSTGTKPKHDQFLACLSANEKEAHGSFREGIHTPFFQENRSSMKMWQNLEGNYCIILVLQKGV